jgi:hypothetical protein
MAATDASCLRPLLQIQKFAPWAMIYFIHIIPITYAVFFAIEIIRGPVENLVNH